MKNSAKITCTINVKTLRRNNHRAGMTGPFNQTSNKKNINMETTSLEIVQQATADELAWLQSRLGKFTSSEVHKLFTGSRTKGEIFGVTAKKYIMTKAAEIMTQELKEQPDFKQMRWGRDHEAEAVEAFEKFIGKNGIYYGTANPKFFDYCEYSGGSPDWEYKKGKVNIGADIKCPFDSAEHIKNLLLESQQEFKDERYEYYCQAQFNMMIRGWNKFLFVSYDPRMVEESYRLFVMPVDKDQSWIDEFKPRLESAINELQLIMATMQKKMTIRMQMIGNPKKILQAA